MSECMLDRVKKIKEEALVEGYAWSPQPKFDLRKLQRALENIERETIWKQFQKKKIRL